MTEPILPTRVIPAGEPIPALPARPPAVDELPPWRAPAVPPEPPAPPAPPVEPEPLREVVHRVTVQLVRPEPEPVRSRWSWTWLTSRIRPWSSLAAAAVVLIPWGGDHSLTTAWSALLDDCRTEQSISAAYALAGTLLGLSLLAERVRPGAVARALFIVALVGGTGALGWYDPITALTGVKP